MGKYLGRKTLDRISNVATMEPEVDGDGYAAQRWAVARHGIALKSLFDVIDDLEAGRLVQVLPPFESP